MRRLKPQLIILICGISLLACGRPRRPVYVWDTSCDQPVILDSLSVRRAREPQQATFSSVARLVVIAETEGQRQSAAIGASVRLARDTSIASTNAAGVTDHTGHVELQTFGGEHRIVISSIGYLRTISTVRLRRGFVDTVHVMLRAHPIC